MIAILHVRGAKSIAWGGREQVTDQLSYKALYNGWEKKFRLLFESWRDF